MLKKIFKNDVNVEIAKANYQKHQKSLERQRQKYIKHLSEEIKRQSRYGARYIETISTTAAFITYDYLTKDLKEYFEQRGFTVTVESNRSGVLASWLRISWGD